MSPQLNQVYARSSLGMKTQRAHPTVQSERKKEKKKNFASWMLEQFFYRQVTRLHEMIPQEILRYLRYLVLLSLQI
jgi:hypothetical protein